MTDRGRDLTAELTADHRALEDLLVRLHAAVGRRERRRLADELTVAVVRHALAEEQHLFPAVRLYVPHGDALAEREERARTEMEAVLEGLEREPVEGTGFRTLLAGLRRGVTEHVHGQEEELFPRVRASLAGGQLRRLGGRVREDGARAPRAADLSPPPTPPIDTAVSLVDRAHLVFSGRTGPRAHRHGW
ncbi:hemerythrin domain-containing protein [Streptomyces bohaiensis]|uniref:Hemerythrin domain-containing protein n=1 Tax=Streptomyces bohaiensis TaxID=1431344 RepID=A0ABX1CJA2_9ACTN|nr:hemerythrin domain-containing protein [Streptomyces bohaiensis]NJQ17364.1 hemerythrin domain-containing protein [Streptomyces bohaiensis]